MIAMHVVWRERERIQKLGIVPKPDVKSLHAGRKEKQERFLAFINYKHNVNLQTASDDNCCCLP